MKTAEYQSRCPLCEDQIEIGDNIEYCHNRRRWHHFSCPWTKDQGYRPDMIILDADDDEIIDIMKHEKNKERDRKYTLRTINEQVSGLESGESAESPAPRRRMERTFQRRKLVVKIMEKCRRFLSFLNF